MTHTTSSPLPKPPAAPEGPPAYPARPRRRGGARASSAAGAKVVRLLPSREAEDYAPRRADALRRVTLQLTDAMAVIASTAVAAALTPLPLSPGAIVAGLLVTFVFVRLVGLHDKDTLVLRRSTLDEVPRLFELSALVACAEWLSLANGPGRLPLAVLTALLLTLFVVLRAGARSTLTRLLPPERCLYIGDGSVAALLRDKVAAGSNGAVIVGEVALDHTATAEDFGGVEGLRLIVRDANVTRVILAPVSVSAADTMELIRVAKEAGVKVSIFPRMFEVVGSAVEFEDLEGLTLLGVPRFGLSSSARAIKRTFDLVGSSFSLLCAAPLMLLITVLIKLDSRGPAMFSQTRVGRDGKRFEILKFRTMVADAERLKEDLLHHNETSGLFKLATDPRITRVGRVLRATSLDELPQLINVLRGEMSIVGPRPLVVDEDKQVIGLGRRRLHLTPGMTGPWQVMRSGRVPMAEMVNIDYLYVSSWSLWTDVKLLLRTVSYVFARGGV